MIKTLPSTRDEGPSLTSPASRAHIAQLRGMVEHNRARWRRLIVLEALGLAVAVPLAYLWLVFILDNLVHLPGWGRFLASVVFVVGVAWLVWRLGQRCRQQRLSEDQVALAMERRTPGGVQNRLINALQLARDSRGTPHEFSEAVVEENYEQLRQATLQQAAQARPALIGVGVAGVLVLVGVLFALLRPAHFSNAAARILMPFAAIDPLYRTTLTVTPGDIEAVGDVVIRIRIHGERPETLTIFREVKGKRGSDVVPVDDGADHVEYVFRNVEHTTTYAVRGGDFTSPYYRIEVPTPSLLSMARVTYRYPAYTKLPDKAVECAGGDLEALHGTSAQVTFVLDRPAEAASLILQHEAKKSERQELSRLSPSEHRGTIVFDGVTLYELETRQEGREAYRSTPYAVRILKDQPPKLELRGLERIVEAAVDAVLPLSVSATDDYGLEKIGVFYRRLNAPPVGKAADISPKTGDDDWKALEAWPGNGSLSFKQNHELVLAALGVAEGDRLELAVRATDADPFKQRRWTTGTVYKLSIGGEGSSLQLIYEQILRSEAEIKALIAAQQQVLAKTNDWLRKLDPASGVKWDDARNVDALTASVKEQGKEQEELRKRAGATAREIVTQAGPLRLSLGMLADTEMVRANRIFESVPLRDDTQRRKAALTDARTTQERTIRSLQEIAEHYAQFRQEWELGHMIAFTKMLADRQVLLRDASSRNAARSADRAAALQQVTASRRQAKVLELAQLAGAAFSGMGERTSAIDAILSKAFAEAAGNLRDKGLESEMKQAASAAKEGRWSEAVPLQAKVATDLAGIYERLRKAQTDAALKALTALQERAKSDAQAQKDIEKLQAGTSEKFLSLKDTLKIEEIIHMEEVNADKNRAAPEKHVEDYLFPDSARGMLQQPDRGIRQEFANLSLAKSPGTTPSFPKQSDRKGNSVVPHIQEKFDDLVGKLLEEADEMQKNYETYNLNAAFNINEPGDVGKQAGDLNSTAASAATGNMKPPTVNVGGASRAGRRGARAHGVVVGDESINRRGRDKVQEGQERVADQPGLIKEKKSDDMQKDTSTGVGGIKVDSDDNKFSVADVGKWTDDMAKRMGKAQEKHSIVERQDGKLDHRVAEMMRDLDSKHEQMIERIKSIRKELKNLYLPTDHLDEIAAELNANLGHLKEQPEAEVFRLQVRALERLRGTLRVFHQASAGFQPSVARDQAVQGRVLDEPARQPLPGYEEAVKQYYQKLSGR